MKNKILLIVLVVGLFTVIHTTHKVVERERQLEHIKKLEELKKVEAERKDAVIKRAIDLIASFEGFRSKPYRCAKGQLTVGYGDGRSLAALSKNKLKSINLSEREAKKALGKRVTKLYEELDAKLFQHNPSLTDNQKIAVLSIADNMGIFRFQRTDLFTLIKGKKTTTAVVHEWRKYIKVRLKGYLKEVKGLVNRRHAEATLYLSK